MSLLILLAALATGCSDYRFAAVEDHGGLDGDGGFGVDETCDTFQVEGDGHVLYCHGTGNGRFVLVASDISSCFPHLDHRHDVFPSTGCDS